MDSVPEITGHRSGAVTERFAAEARAARSARDWAEPVLQSWTLDPDAQAEALLLLSELVTNAVFHGAGPIDVRLARLGTALRLEVSDTGVVGVGGAHHPGPDEVGGRGLLIIEHISRAWGVEDRADGKTVWAELALE